MFYHKEIQKTYIQVFKYIVHMSGSEPQSPTEPWETGEESASAGLGSGPADSQIMIPSKRFFSWHAASLIHKMAAVKWKHTSKLDII